MIHTTRTIYVLRPRGDVRTTPIVASVRLVATRPVSLVKATA